MTLDAHSFELVHQETRLSTDAFYDRPVGITDVCYPELGEMLRMVTSAAHVHVCHHQMRAAKHNADGDGLDTSVQPDAFGVHSDSSRHAGEAAFLSSLRSMPWTRSSAQDASCIDGWRNITKHPIENNQLAVYDETCVVPDDRKESLEERGES